MSKSNEPSAEKGRIAYLEEKVAKLEAQLAERVSKEEERKRSTLCRMAGNIAPAVISVHVAAHRFMPGVGAVACLSIDLAREIYDQIHDKVPR